MHGSKLAGLRAIIVAGALRTKLINQRRHKNYLLPREGRSPL